VILGQERGIELPPFEHLKPLLTKGGKLLVVTE
jgi:hypothetical protein